jgi:PKD repeat protein
MNTELLMEVKMTRKRLVGQISLGIFTLLLVLIHGSPVAAATCIWNGSSGSWDDDSRWSCGHVPGPDDTAVISIGTSNVSVDNDATVGALTQSSGTLTGDATLTVDGLFTWTGGWQSGDGLTQANGGLAIGGSVVNLYRDLNLPDGQTAVVSTAVLMWHGGDSQLNNAGHFDLQADATISGVSPLPGTINNSGTFSKSGGAGNASISSFFHNSGLVHAGSGTLRIGGGGGTDSGSYQATAVLDFYQGTRSIGPASSISGSGIVRFSGTNPNNVTIEGDYDVAATEVMGTVPAVHFNTAATTGTLTQSGGTLHINAPLTTGTFNQSSGSVNLGTSNLIVSGPFSRSGGTFNAQSGAVIFAAPVSQTLTLNVTTNFYDVVVNSGTLVVETVAANNGHINGTLTNQGVIRKTQAIGGSGNVGFGLTGVTLNVTDQGSLSSVQVDRVGGNHPQADNQTATGQYWQMTPEGGGYTVDLTLPHSLVDHEDALACRYTGSDWDCGRSSSTATTVTRAGVDQLSDDWAVGSSSAPAPPQTGFSSNSPITLGQTAVFTNSTSGDGPISYAWDFGDGSPVVTSANPTHMYTAAGNYTVKLTATNAGGSDEYTATFVVQSVAEPEPEYRLYLPLIVK